MQNPTKPELEQLVDTFRAVTEEDLTEPLLPKMRNLLGKLDRCCGPAKGTKRPMPLGQSCAR